MSVKTIILGAGLAGLGAAYNSDLPIYEQNSEPGGTAASISKDGCIFDYGIHVLHSKDERIYSLLRETGTELYTQKRKAWIYSHGSFASYPFQVNSSHLPLTLKFKCVFDFLTRKKNKEIKNYEDWMRVNFGNGFAETFLIPYSEKFWLVPPRDMTFEWTGERVPQPRKIDVIKGAFIDHEGGFGPNVQFHYPLKSGDGFGGIAKALASKVKNINYNMKATKIDLREKLIWFNSEEQQSYEKIISTIPLPELFEILTDTPEDIQGQVDKLSCNSIAIINLSIDVPSLSDKHWIHYPEEEFSFFRISFPENFCEGLIPKNKSAVQAEISFDYEHKPSKEYLIKRVCDDLIKAKVLRKDDKIFYRGVEYLKYGYVIFDHNREKALKEIHEYLRSLDIYPCGRYGCWEYQWCDEAVFSGQATANEVNN